MTEEASRATIIRFMLKRDATVVAAADESGLLSEERGLMGEPAVVQTLLLLRGLLCGEKRRLAMKGAAP